MSTPAGLFDTIVNRADGFLRLSRPGNVQQALQAWHARTRFARRVPLDLLVQILQSRPAGNVHWSGGKDGQWVEGEARFP